MKKLPDNVTQYKRTPTFDENSIPKGLLRSHTTKEGCWGHIVILEGKLLYRILEPKIEETELSEELPGVAEPSIKHEIAPLGKVRFYVDFYK